MSRTTRSVTPRPWRPSLAALLALALVTACTQEDQRAAFLAAETALAQGDRALFEELRAGLDDYPLAPYLTYQDLTRDLDAADPAAVEGFLTAHADTYLAERLRRAWLARLAARGRWEDYLRLYGSSESAELRCHRLTALTATGRGAEALAGVEPLWLAGRSQPDACDGPFEAWRAAGRLTPELAWARIALALEAGETGLARYLGRYLPETDRPWLERWLALRRDPSLALRPDARPDPLPGGHPQQGRMLAEALVRLAARTPEKVSEARDGAVAAGLLDAAGTARVDAAVGLALADVDAARGLAVLDRVPARADNQDVQERRLRIALKLGDWVRVAAWTTAMPASDAKTEHWRYWQARAAEALGDAEAAGILYRQAAAERSLWGFLAAERAGVPYRLESVPVPADPGHVDELAEGPAGARIRELRALGRHAEARREWRHLTTGMDPAGLAAAAVAAERLGWPDQAIFTLAESGHWDDLALRFPVVHRETVTAKAREADLPESLVFAVLRQESAFDPRAQSAAGARGLMQLMPATARSLARNPGVPDLLDPEQNIALGSRYLADMRQRFGGHPALAAAAYNAGPARVSRWLPAAPVDADVWIATIPFAETRAYVRRVLAYRVIYDSRLGRPVAPLGPELLPVGGTAVTHAPASGGGDGAG